MVSRIAKTLAVWTLLLTAAVSAAAGEHPPPTVGGTLPAFTLPPPADPEKRAYLGLEENRSFILSGIRAQVVIVEIFNMY